MAYFKINGVDFSEYVNELSIKRKNNYSAQTNAAGDTVVDYINIKRQISVGIITLDETNAKKVLDAIEGFNVLISYRDPKTNALVENVNCIIPDHEVEYYTIQTDKVLVNDFKLKFTEL